MAHFNHPNEINNAVVQEAIKKSASFAKTVTAPVMSASKSKVQIMRTMVNPSDDEKYFILQYVRHRDYTKAFKPFLMHYDESSTWIDQLEPVKQHSMLV